MRGLTNKVDQNCTISYLKGNFVSSARHVTVRYRYSLRYMQSFDNETIVLITGMLIALLTA